MVLSRDIRVKSLGKFGGGIRSLLVVLNTLIQLYFLLNHTIHKFYEGLTLQAYDLTFDLLVVPLWGKCYIPGYTNRRRATSWLISMTDDQDPPNRIKIYNKIAAMMVATLVPLHPSFQVIGFIIFMLLSIHSSGRK